MKTLTATDVARRFSSVLDSLEHGGEEIVIVRNHQPIAKLVPGAPRLPAVEALADLYQTLDDTDGAEWLRDVAGFDHAATGEITDPWA